MIQNSLLTIILGLFLCAGVNSQEALKYQLPPEEIVKIVDAPATPLVSVSSDKTVIVIIERAPIVTINELSEEELRIGGLRINPKTSGPSRLTHNKGFRTANIDGTTVSEIEGMPGDPKLGAPIWSPDGRMFAFTNTRPDEIELWVCDIALKQARKIAGNINMVFGTLISWLPDNKSLVYCITDPGRGRAPEPSSVPEGPVVQENLGKQGQAATFQDLLKDPADEAVFEYYAKSQLMLWNGLESVARGKPGMITGFSPSPDGHYLLVTTIARPFSYVVPYYYFTSVTRILDINGNEVRILYEKPLTENLPRGYDIVLPGPRSFSWRPDKPATLHWVEALDDGDYSREMKYHDQVFTLSSPFTGSPQKFLATEMRFGGIVWGRDDFALISEGLSRTRIRITSSFNPSDPQNTKKKIQEYNTDDRYNNPGRFITDQNEYGRNVLLFTDRGRALLLSGNGSSDEGDRPFIDRYDIASGKTARLWRSAPPFYETVSEVLDISKGLLLTSRQSPTEVPNYYIRNLRNGRLTQV
ncbi:MAG TPA: hypothetical protein VK861_06670, partial [Bacteroidales bacterium]|nr:hypothetical protein [Bacteroidales bacterium]